MIKPWTRLHSQQGPSFGIFSVRTDRAISPRTGKEHDFHIMEAVDWINVIPITPDHRVVMIRQYRHGSREVTLEIPGGLLDPGDTPERAAGRELLEETGYEAGEMKKIGVVNPNPAIFNNLCHTFLAQNVKKVCNPMPDQTEDIEVVLIPLTDIPKLIQRGEINHALVIAAFYWHSLRFPEGLTKP